MKIPLYIAVHSPHAYFTGADGIDRSVGKTHQQAAVIIQRHGAAITGILTANKLMTYRIGQLEKKVEKHNSVIERVYELEKHEAVVDEEILQLKRYHD